MKKKQQTIYIVGIKGVATSALALLYKQQGMRVFGSDVAEKFPTDEELSHAKIPVSPGFDPQNVRRVAPDKVVYTGAHGGRDNPEVQEAIAMGIPVFTHAEALGALMESHIQVSVAGSHGKTTVSAMIATILAAAGKDPSWAVGCGGIVGLGAAGHMGGGSLFVAEADEYVNDPGHDDTPRFLFQKPDVLVITNIDYDHPDVYGSLEEVVAAFEKLAARERGMRVRIVSEDDPASRALKENAHTLLTFGFSPNAMVRVGHVGVGEGRTFFTLTLRGVAVGEFALKVPGRHNVANAAAAAAACFSLGVSWEEIRQGLLAFGGTKRRFEKIGEAGGILVFDDYAHHPKEIEATLAAARLWYPKRRIVTMFQPHTYSRTKALLADFGKSFAQSDVVICCDIYFSAREKATGGITGETLAAEIAKNHKAVTFARDYEEAEAHALSQVAQGDILIGMGAGNIYSWIRDIVKRMETLL